MDVIEELANQVLVQAGVDLSSGHLNGTNDACKCQYFPLLEQMLHHDDATPHPSKPIASNINTETNHTKNTLWTPYSDQDHMMFLEEYGPFTDSSYAPFYEVMSLLLCQALTPSSTPRIHNRCTSSNLPSTTTNPNFPHPSSTTNSIQNQINVSPSQNIADSFEQIHNRHNMRGLRILIALQNLPPNTFNFMSLLHPPTFAPKNGDKKGVNNSDKNTSSLISPLIVSLMKHVASLPDLEMNIRSIQKHLYQQAFQHSTSSSTPSIYFDSSHSFTATASSSSYFAVPTVNREEHMQKIHALSTQLEKELSDHIQSLEFIIGYIYGVVDTNGRSYMRTRIGGLLHTFSLTHDKPRHLGTTSGGMGDENTNACGIDMILWVLYRIILGFPTVSGRTANDNVASSNGNAVYTHLLKKILVPLHTPHEMVLWRDQIPMLSLYHEPLVLCIVELCRRISTSAQSKGTFGEVDKGNIEKIIYNQSLLANVDSIIQALLDPNIWPIEHNAKNNEGGRSSIANTPKVVLILHEIDTILEKVLGSFTAKDYADALQQNINNSTQNIMSLNFIVPLVLRLCTCIQGDNSRTSERALEFFKSKSFEVLLKQPYHLERCMRPLMRALCRVDRNMELAWNPTVNKMTKLVLMKLEEWDAELFARTANSMFQLQQHHTSSHANDNNSLFSSNGTSITGATPIGAQRLAHPTDQKPSYNKFSLKNSMGGWKPPPKKSINNKSTAPPLTVTGVAPWAMSSSSTTSSFPNRKSNSNNSSMMPPPSTITGVAPWAVSPALPKASFPRPIRPNQKQILPTTTTKTPKISISSSPLGIASNNMNMEEESVISKNSTSEQPDRGLLLVRNFMGKLTPQSSDADENTDDTISSWAKAQIMESPVLMPNLKFHDLVFRHDELGSGAFSTVKYARLIVKDKTRSNWPEYAVKIVSTSKIEELGYSSSINREISILSMLSHPNIARLISSFRFRDGAYLVLEYASKGDLHTILQRDGSLDHPSAKFVIGEIVTALHSVHELGFVYGDIKPENVLLTETGHIKLTDFGGCRAVEEKAKDRLRKMKNLWTEMRDGDWREKQTDSVNVNAAENSMDSDVSMTDESEHNDTIDFVDNQEEEEEDLRIEGTTAYLPPEVVLGGVPTIAADAWALGCVLYQCLSGRPPILEDTDTETKQKIVTFHMDDQANSFFGENQKDTEKTVFQPETKALIRKLLSRSPLDRPTMEMVAIDDFFEGISNVFCLYMHPAPPLNVGKVAPSPNAKWARRQYSSIWAPQPKSYGLEHLDQKRRNRGGEGWNAGKEVIRKEPLLQGDEAKTFFLSRSRLNPRNLHVLRESSSLSMGAGTMETDEMELKEGENEDEDE